MKAILTLLLFLSGFLLLLGVLSYRAGNELGIIPLIGGLIFAFFVLTIWILAIVQKKNNRIENDEFEILNDESDD